MKPKSMVAGVAPALALAGVLGLPAGEALAQNATDQTQAATAPADQNATAQNGAAVGELQEVVVTAERRATDVQATPIAVTAVSGEQMTNLHMNDISDLQQMVPSFQSDDESGFFNSINIRGMGNSAITPSIATGVAVFRDGLFMQETIAEDEPMFDIADTEVLEGPQGTFVGASSTAGAVMINSANPNFNGLNGYVLAGVGNYSDTKFQGGVNLPVSDTFAVRFAFNNEQRGSFYNDIGSTLNGYYFSQYVPTFGTERPMLQGTPAQSLPITDPGHLNSRQARLKLLWKPSDNLQVLGDAEYSFINTGGEPAEPNPLTFTTLFGAGAGPGYAGCTGVAAGAPVTCSGAGTSTHATYYYPGEQPFVLDYYGTGQQEDELLTHYSMELRYTLPDGIVVRSLSGFVHIDINHQDNMSYGPQDAGWLYHEIGPNDNYDSEEINIISPTTGKTNWIVGGFWDYRDTPVFTNALIVTPQYQPNQLPVLESFGASSTVARVAAVFGQFNWQFADTLQVQLGARENWDNNFVFQPTGIAPPPGTLLQSPAGTGTYAVNNTAAACPGLTAPCYTVRTAVPASGGFKDTVPTGKIDLNWTPVPGQNFYLFYARGYKSGGANSGSGDHPYFQPEHVNDYELGWKGRLLEGHMLTQVGGYYINYQNMQYPLEDIEAAADTSIGSYTANLAASTIYGLEVSEQSRFGGFGLDLGFAYTHSALGAVTTLPAYALPIGWGSPQAIPQCLAGHTYTGTPGCFNYQPYEVNLSGEANPFSPKITVNLSADYIFHVGSGTLDPRVTFAHSDQQYASIFQVPYNLMGARNLWTASLDWVVGKWDAQLYGTNLSNETYIIAGGNPLYYGPPRQMGVQGTYRF